MYLTPVFFAQILTVPVGRVWRFTHFYSVTLLPGKWFTCHHFVQEWQASIYCHFVKNCFPFLLQLAPSVNLSVDTFPDKRGRLTVRILFFLGKKSFTVFRRLTYIKTINSFFLSRSLPPNTEGSAEPCEAIGASLRTQVRIFKSCNLCPDSSLYPILFYFSIPDRFLRPFKNDRQIFTIVL